MTHFFFFGAFFTSVSLTMWVVFIGNHTFIADCFIATRAVNSIIVVSNFTTAITRKYIFFFIRRAIVSRRMVRAIPPVVGTARALNPHFIWSFSIQIFIWYNGFAFLTSDGFIFFIKARITYPLLLWCAVIATNFTFGAIVFFTFGARSTSNTGFFAFFTDRSFAFIVTAAISGL